MSESILTAFRLAIENADSLEEKAMITNDLARELLGLSLYDEASSTAREALTISIETKSKLQEGRALGMLGNISLNLGDYHDALEYYEQALGIFEILNDKSRMAIIIGNIGRVHRSLSNYPQAIEYYQRALAIDKEVGNKQGMANHIGNIGNVYFILSNYMKAIEYYQNALLLSEELGNTSATAIHIGNLGNVYLNLYEYNQALEYYQKSLTILSELGDKLGVANTTGNIAGAYFNLKEYPKSLEYYRTAIEMYEEIGSKAGIADISTNLGILYKELGEYQKSIEHYTRALLINQELGNMLSVACNTSGLGVLFGEIKFDGYDSKKAEDYLLQAIAINENLGSKKEIYENHQILSDLYNQIGEGTKAYHHYKIYHELEKDVQNEAMRKQAEQLNYERKTTEREMQIAVDRAKHEATEQLLHNTLPPQIANRLLEGEKIADTHENVSVLFIDIVGFTKMSTTIPASELIDLLDIVFSRFDMICKKFGLEKIKTIGDAYMAVCGAPVAYENHAARVALAALEMLEDFSLERRFSVPIDLGFRIGLHSGSVVAGIIGEYKLSYDLWGDAVNTASRMESHGEEDKIHVSEEFRTALISTTTNELPIRFIPRGEMDIKGKGKMKTYFLEKL
ncbi:MAG: tetratricopeptide repeat protein [Bacteroidetes bacterium]|nr:tetratricopeptide repeat protein [Bacteroidota bacterium]